MKILLQSVTLEILLFTFFFLLLLPLFPYLFIYYIMYIYYTKHTHTHTHIQLIEDVYNEKITFDGNERVTRTYLNGLISKRYLHRQVGRKGSRS